MSELLYGTEWLSLYKTPKGFIYAERKGKDSVAVFLTRGLPNGQYEVLVRYQPLPVDNQPVDKDEKLYPCPVTGGIEENESIYGCAAREVEEETGYMIDKDHFLYLAQYYPSTQINEIVYILHADVTGVVPRTATQDGTYFESISKNVWEPLEALQRARYAGSVIGYHKVKEWLEKK